MISPMRSHRRGSIGVLFVLGAAVLLGAHAAPDANAERAAALAGLAPIPLFMASDSVAQGALEELDAALPDHALGFLAFPGLRLPIVTNEIGKYRDQIGDTVVVSLTNNHFFTPSTYARELDALMAQLRSLGVSNVVWVNAHLWHPSMRSINADIRAAATRWPEITIADWASTARPEHLENDGVHLRKAGQIAMAELIAGHVREIDGVDRAPIGTLDSVTVGSTITVGGWAFDRDTTGPIAVHVYVDGRFVQAVRADRPRPDVAAAHAVGPNHGYRSQIDRPARDGDHTLCTYAINSGDRRPNSALGCRSFGVESSPVGALDRVEVDGDELIVRGWAHDPDEGEPTQVHVYVRNRMLGHVDTHHPRPDVARALGITGLTGFAGPVDAPDVDGEHTICAYAINRGAGTNTNIGCTTKFLDIGPPGPWIRH